MKAILTGFQPFGGELTNPSYEAVRLIPDALDDCKIIKMELPVEYKTAADILLDKITEVLPDAVIIVGQAGGRDAVTPELIAVNYADASAPDNAGVVHMGDFIIPPDMNESAAEIPAGYFSTLPYIEMVTALRENNIKSVVSPSAGLYVCNDLMYRTLHSLKINPNLSHIRCGFIHVPYADSQDKSPSLPLETIAEAIAICTKVCTKYQNTTNFNKI